MISNRGLAIKELESKYLREDAEDFSIGDTVKVHFKIKEGKRERVQIFEGIVIAMNGTGLRTTLTVRKLSFNNINVERVFPLHSPKIDKITVSRQGRVRRAKLYYLRGRKGKAAQVKRLMDNKSKVSVTPKTTKPIADEVDKKSADGALSEASSSSPDVKQNS